MPMVSYAAGSRYLALIGGVIMSFYDWYCDLPPASPQTWGEQTADPESADWYTASFLILWGSNVPQTRTPDAHFYTEARYRGAKSVVVSPDYSEAAKFAGLWLHPKQGTDAALALAMGHVILKEFHLARSVPYFADYCRRFTDLPLLIRLETCEGHLVPGRYLRAADLAANAGEANNPEWKTLACEEGSGALVFPNGSSVSAGAKAGIGTSRPKRRVWPSAFWAPKRRVSPSSISAATLRPLSAPPAMPRFWNE
jgi:nitrate reductase / nitrite oxidoreductase, alpha subunit